MPEKNKEVEQLEEKISDFEREEEIAQRLIRDRSRYIYRLERQDTILTVIVIIMALIIIVLASKLAALF